MTSNIVFTAIARLLTTAAAVVATIVTARTLGVEARGEYYYILTIALLGAQIANLGLSSSNALLAARDRSMVSQLFFNSLWIAVILGPLAVLGIFGVGAVVSESALKSTPLLVWAVLIAPCALFFNLGSSLLIAVQEFRKYNLIAVGAAALQLILLLIVASVRPTVAAFLVVSLICLLASSYALTVAIYRVVPHFRLQSLSIPVLRQGIGFAARAFLILLFGFLLSRMPVIASGRIGDATSAGIVSIVIQFLDVLVILPASVAMILFPSLVVSNPSDGPRQALRATAWVVAAMSMVSVALAIVAEPLIVLMFGQAFAPSAAALQWALPGIVLLSAVSVLGQYLAANGFPPSAILAWALATFVGYAFAPEVAGSEAPIRAMKALTAAYGVLLVGMGLAFASTARKARGEQLP